MNSGPRCIAIGIALAMLSSCQQKTKAAEDQSPTPVHAVQVKLFTPRPAERYSASLTPAQQLTLSFRVGGLVESVDPLQAGDPVPAGAVLATLRPLDYDLQIRQAKAQLESSRRNIEVARSALAEAEAALTKADAAWKRATALYESRALTAPDFEAAKAQRDAAAAQVNSARSQIEAATAQESSAAAALVFSRAGENGLRPDRALDCSPHKALHRSRIACLSRPARLHAGGHHVPSKRSSACPTRR